MIGFPSSVIILHLYLSEKPDCDEKTALTVMVRAV